MYWVFEQKLRILVWQPPLMYVDKLHDVSSMWSPLPLGVFNDIYSMNLSAKQFAAECSRPPTFLQLGQKQIEQRIWFVFLNLKPFKSPRYKDLQYTLFKKSWFSKEKKPGFIGISSFSINPKRSSYITFQDHSPPMKYQKIS